MKPLTERVASDLARDLPSEVNALVEHLAGEPGAVAILFYGSVLRTGKLDDLLDFYVLTDGERVPLIWPSISFHVVPVGTRLMRAKVATVPLSVFGEAAMGLRLDTTIWTRFCQPSALAWARDAVVAHEVASAVAAAIVAAAGYAAVLGPKAAPAEAFWTDLFDQTYDTEFRVEAPGRSAIIVNHAPDHYNELLPLAWAEAGIGFVREGEALRPDLPSDLCVAVLRGWFCRAALGRTLNILRLLKAAFTLQGASSYAFWKIERHLGIEIRAEGWRRDHPILAAPGVVWQVSRARSRQWRQQRHLRMELPCGRSA